MKIIYLLLFLINVGNAIAQRHEAGLSGGILYENATGKENDNQTWFTGWEAGAYYKYTPIKWIGLQTGIYCNHVKKDLNTSHLNPKGSLVIPIQAVLFSGFRFNLTGGLYLENLTGQLRYKVENPQEKTYTYGKIAKYPALGYQIGGKWNMKYCNIVFIFRKCFSSYIKPKPESISWPFQFLSADPKATSIHLSVEIPLWRYGKK